MTDMLFTHTDLDGSGCAIVAKYVFDCEVQHHTYRTLDKTLEKFITSGEYKKYDNIYIADIAPESEVAELIDKTAPDKFQLFDHHESRESIAKYDWAHYDVDKCGAKIFYDHLRENGYDKALAPLDEFIHLVDVYDRWQKDDPGRERSEHLNIFHSYIGRDEFIERSVNADNPAELSVQEQKIVDTEIKHMNYYVWRTAKSAKQFQDSDGNTFALAFYENHPNEVADKLCEDDKVDYAVLINLKSGSGSVRSRNGFDVSKVAEKLGGGGHEAAAGFRLDTRGFYEHAASFFQFDDDETDDNDN